MRIVSVAFLALFGCAADPATDSFDPNGEQPTSVGKSDAPQACGRHGDVCAPSLCGAKYDDAGKSWVRSCAAEDDAPSTFVSFSMTGDITSTVDSRDLPYAPATAVNGELSNALHYGCEVYPESTTVRAPEEGVLAYFAEFDYASWTSVPSRPRRLIYVRVTNPTSTPGVYQGYASYRDPSDPTVPAYGGIGMPDHLCTVKASTDSAGAVSASFTCHDVFENDGDGSLEMTGEFKCPQNTLDRGVWTTLAPR